VWICVINADAEADEMFLNSIKEYIYRVRICGKSFC
jgi:hypothetical protein